MEMALTFNEVQFDIIDHQNRPWLRSPQIADALGYGQVNRINDLYCRHADGFTESMTALIKLPSDGGEQETRIISLRGCHLLARLERTPVAKSFRKWVLDVLDRIAKEESEKAANPDFPYSLTITSEQQRILQGIVDAKVRMASGANNPVRREFYAQTWNRFKSHFLLAKYQQLPQTKLVEAISYLVQMDIQPKKQKAIEAQPKIHVYPAEDKYKSYLYDVEAFRAETAATIETLLHRGLNLADAKNLGAGGVIALTPVMLDWLQRVAVQTSPILRRNEPVCRAIDYSPLYLVRHLESVQK